MSREAKCLVIVHGGYSIRAGMGIHDLFQQPSVTLNARVGLSRAWLRQRRKSAADPSSFPPPQALDYLVGQALDDALSANPSDIIIYRPLQGAHVADWQQLIALWRHLLFDLLRIKRSRNDSHTLLSLPAPIHRDTYTTAAQVFFELFNTPALSIVETPLVSAYAAGTLTGVTVDIGWAGCSITPIVDCEVRHEAIVRTRVGTRLCTIWLAHLLAQDSSIVQELGRIAGSAPSSAEASSSSSTTQSAVHELLVDLAQLLLEEGHIRMTDEGDHSSARAHELDDEGNLDIAAALVQGRERDLVEEQERKKAAEAAEDAAAKGDEEAGGAAAAAKRAEAQKQLQQQGQAGGSTDPNAVTVDFRGRRITVGPSRFRFAEPMLADPTVLHAVKLPQLHRHPFLSPTAGGADEEGDDQAGEDERGFGAGLHEGERLSQALLQSFVLADDEDDPSISKNGKAITTTTFNSAMTLPEAIALAIQRTLSVTLGNAYLDASVPFAVSERRLTLWENLVITGAPTRIKGFTPALTAACGLHVGAAAQGQGHGGGGAGEGGEGAGLEGVGVVGLGPGTQARNVRALKVPDYFAEFKDRTDLAPFLGASIYTKLTLGNPAGTSFISKEAYNDRGPSVFFTILGPA
ncbi:unnamed protein product [Tilletia controversa]|uniref:Uncharacterized protein n=3 Tax=Tilletia TaxID=13289 RepID=A0A8X7SYW6_9BASI|nr:hypothetical protein CF336_g3618 [Tilletia laevis]KAE8199282.1 hypothetical protein CF328_g3297 [Tilletia controversa]KAE8261787.1 hypothetical protein A4X03_0g2969 [Tilletia caries]KAE8204051.1 hypothetical protein CF335_g2792 [Tilletia laevis]KAE8252282.1 hypothetical protein A4X06_0g2300 [Tilletia controversa]